MTHESSLARRPLHGRLPMPLSTPGFACPICGATVHLTGVTEWGADDGEIIGVEYDCETEPDIDSDEWPEWHAGHFAHPYIDWLPWEMRMVTWLNRYYHYREENAPHEG
jgi:hypothetical protein